MSFKIVTKTGTAKVNTFVDAQNRARELSTVKSQGEECSIFGAKGKITTYQNGICIGRKPQLAARS